MQGSTSLGLAVDLKYAAAIVSGFWGRTRVVVESVVEGPDLGASGVFEPLPPTGCGTFGQSFTAFGPQLLSLQNGGVSSPYCAVWLAGAQKRSASA